MSIKLMTIVWDMELPHTEKLVMLALADNANDAGACWPSISTLAAKCCMDRATVIRRLHDLENRGLIVRSSDSGKTNSYQLHLSQPATSRNLPLVAQSDGTSRSVRPVPVAACDPTRRSVRPRTIIEPSDEPSENRHVRNAREVPRGTSEDWEKTYNWVLSDLRPVYPSNLGTDAMWQSVARVLAGRVQSGETTRSDLMRLTQDFAAQVDAKGSRNTQFVTSALKHYDGRGEWKGPFPLPASAAKPREETPMERIHRLNSQSRVLDGEVING